MRLFDLVVAGRATASSMMIAAGALGLGTNRHTKPSKPRIAFQAYAVHLAQCYAPILSRLRREAPHVQLDFIILPHPHFPPRSRRELRSFAIETLAFPVRNVRSYWQTLWDDYDLLVCTDVFAGFPLRRTKTVLLKHGVGVMSRAVEPHLLRKTAFHFDLVLVSGQADRDVLLNAAPPSFAANQVVSVGLPYADRLDRVAETRSEYLRRLGLDPAEPVVLVSPHWRGPIATRRKTPTSLDDLVQTLAELGAQTIVKLHACSLNKAMAGGEDWMAKLEAYRALGAAIDNDIDDVPALQHADVLISDVSSRAFNFMLLDKPVILAAPENHCEDEVEQQRLRLMRKGARVVRSTAELRSLLSAGLRKLATLRNCEPDMVSRCFANRGHATEAVVEELLRQIDVGC